MDIVRYSLEKPVTVAVAVILLVTFGIIGLNKLPVQLTPDVIQMIDGIQPTMVQWDSHGGMVTNFKVLSIMLPRTRNDSEQQSGIVHGSW